MNSIRIIAGLLTLFVATASMAATALNQPHVLTPQEYNFPLTDRYIATVSSAIDGTNVPFKTIEIETRKDRRNVPLLEGRNKIPLVLFAQKNKTAPLAFVISGTGGTALAGSSLLLAGELFNMGYHVVTLPNPVSWMYILGESQSGLPGFMPRDSKEFYGFAQQVTVMLKKQEGLSISGYSVLGYSYGGLLAGFLAKEDATQQVFNFSKVVIINPAVDVPYSIKMLDGYYDEGKKMSPDRKTYVYGGILNVGGEMLTTGLNPSLVNSAVASMHIQPVEEKWLIGESFRDDLTDMIFTSQQINNTGLLKQHADNTHWNAREAEAHEISYTEYMNVLVFPSVMAELNAGPEDRDALLKASNFYNLADTLKNNSHIYIMENADDFLLQQGDLQFMSENVGSRLFVYPYGGHIGNLWFKRNQDDLRRIMMMKNAPTPAQDQIN